MVRYLWVVFGAIAGGVAIATVLGGSSRFGNLAVLIALLPALSLTLLVRLRHTSVVAPVDLARLERQRLEREYLDNERLVRIRQLVSDRTIDWLQAQDFATTWRDTPLASLRELRQFDGVRGPLVRDDSGDAIVSLHVATSSFLDFYDLNTRPDPLLVGSDWREMGSPAGDGTESPEALGAAQAQLMARATAFLRAWDVIVAIDSHARKRALTTGRR
jgi:hypothetical protein